MMVASPFASAAVSNTQSASVDGSPWVHTMEMGGSCRWIGCAPPIPIMGHPFVFVSSFGLHRGAANAALGNGPPTVRGPLQCPREEGRNPRCDEGVDITDTDMG